ncbi:ankyrin repeat-containing domain protein [Favolaschia claudopus]|uniref:Ankyrin repeat-containing domain protein n=1 Tax=Favolaschia claudopus TaxID=2862362 RepID=A0AAW0A1V8_9AGAR
MGGARDLPDPTLVIEGQRARRKTQKAGGSSTNAGGSGQVTPSTVDGVEASDIQSDSEQNSPQSDVIDIDGSDAETMNDACQFIRKCDDERTQHTTHITSLQRACLRGDEEAVHMLLEVGVNINEETLPYGTALHAAAVCGHLPVVCILLANGANVNAKTPMFGAPLRAASLAGHADIVLLLLENGAEIDARANNGSALAAALSCGREEVAQLLMDRGANVNDQV